MDEQRMINQFYKKFTANEDLTDEIETIHRRFPQSVVLQYYIGAYYDRIFDIAEAEEQYLKCIRMSPWFAPPYFSLCNYYLSIGRFSDAEKHLLSIFNKQTIDPTSPILRYQFNLIDNIRICSMLCPEYIKRQQKGKALGMYTTMIAHFKSPNAVKEIEYVHVEGWKNLCYGAGNILIDTDPEKAIELYLDGLRGFSTRKYVPTSATEQGMIHTLDKMLLHGYNLVRSYVVNPSPAPMSVNKMYDRYRSTPLPAPPSSCTPIPDDKIRVGYISPDLNKNAVGLFVTPLFKHFDASRFDVFVYYTNESSDEFTQIFRSYPNITWRHVFKKPNEEIYALIKYTDQIHILVDLIGAGVNNNLELLAMAPAPIIVNYLGYPDYTHLKEVSYRLTDAISDPESSLPPSSATTDYHETLIRLPRTFICYSLFENIRLPDIAYSPSPDGKLRLGLMNKTSKHHVIPRTIWKAVLEQKPHYTLYIKLGKGQTADSLRTTLYKDFPPTQLEFLPFTDSLEEYLQQYNALDYCVDTYPYSGTTTTCSSLLMGVPVITVYNPTNRHVSNVTTSIMFHTDKDATQPYVASSLADYKQILLTLDTPMPVERRHALREAFLKAMDPEAFMEDYQTILEQLFSTKFDSPLPIEHDTPAASLSGIVTCHGPHHHPKLIQALCDAGVTTHRSDATSIVYAHYGTHPISLPANDTSSSPPHHIVHLTDTALSIEPPHTISDLVSACKMGWVSLIAPSKRIAEGIQKQIGGKPESIPPGVDLDCFRPRTEDRDDLREMYGLPLDATVFLYVEGRTNSLSPPPTTVIQGFYDIASTTSDTYLIIKTCDESPNPAIKQTVQALINEGRMDGTVWKYTVSKRVYCFAEWMEDPNEMAELYAVSDVCIVTHPMRGTSALLEALATGLHVILPRGHDIEEVALIPREAKTYCSTADLKPAIQIAMTASATQTGRTYVSRYYTWEHTAKRLLRLFHTKLGTRPRNDIITCEVLMHHLIYGTGTHRRTVEHIPTNPRYPTFGYFVVQLASTVDLYVVQIDHAKAFLEEVAPTITRHFILYTHTGDENINERYIPYLDNTPMLVAWCTHNACVRHPKLHCLPLGIANSGWAHGDLDVLARATTTSYHRPNLCYLGCDIKTNPSKRTPLKAMTNYYEWQDQTLPYKEYLELLATHQYAICPEGKGVDTHRFWECLYLNVTPIVLRSVWSDMWKDKVNVLVVDSWEKVTPTFLRSLPPPSISHQPQHLHVAFYKQLISILATSAIVVAASTTPGFTFEPCLQQLRQAFHGTVILWVDAPDAYQHLAMTHGAHVMSTTHTQKEVMEAFQLTSAFFIKNNVMVYRNLAELVLTLPRGTVQHGHGDVIYVPCHTLLKAADNHPTSPLPRNVFESLSAHPGFPASAKKVMATLELRVPEDIPVWTSVISATTPSVIPQHEGKNAKLKQRKLVDLSII